MLKCAAIFLCSSGWNTHGREYIVLKVRDEHVSFHLENRLLESSYFCQNLDDQSNAKDVIPIVTEHRSN